MCGFPQESPEYLGRKSKWSVASSQGPLRRGSGERIRSPWPIPTRCPGNSTEAGGKWDDRNFLTVREEEI